MVAKLGVPRNSLPVIVIRRWSTPYFPKLRSGITLETLGTLLAGLQAITNVTFTGSRCRSSIASWFGSSGGGLPRRPELNKLRALLFFGIQALSS
jgi:hypothetical protein